MHRVPSPIEPYVVAFCLKVVPSGKPIEVPCCPLIGKPLKECFSIVPEHIAANGGVQKFGWAIWEWPGVLVEAEFHTVWQAPDGQLMDITPNPLLPKATVFLPDPNRKYLGVQVDNIREPLVRDHDVTRLIFIYRRYTEILNEGDLANQHGEIALPKRAAREARRIQKEMANLQRRLERRYG